VCNGDLAVFYAERFWLLALGLKNYCLSNFLSFDTILIGTLTLSFDLSLSVWKLLIVEEKQSFEPDAMVVKPLGF
jgi:hypothetical protein